VIETINLNKYKYFQDGMMFEIFITTTRSSNSCDMGRKNMNIKHMSCNIIQLFIVVDTYNYSTTYVINTHYNLQINVQRKISRGQ